MDSILPLMSARKLLGQFTCREIRKRSAFIQPENNVTLSRDVAKSLLVTLENLVKTSSAGNGSTNVSA
ncbi:MAG: hypothetical protein AABY93_14695 [Bacteroidota bacterium]